MDEIITVSNFKDELKEDEILYFGYGSNLHKEDWERYCLAKGKDYAGAELTPVASGWVIDYKMIYHFFAKSRKGGAADIIPTQVDGKAVPGVLFKANRMAQKILDIKEGYPTVYDRIKVVVCTMSMEVVEALSYRVVESQIQPKHLPPRKEYADLIRIGLSRVQLPTNYLETSIQRHLTFEEDNLSYVFVYGTLRKGECRNWCIEKLQPKTYASATIAGRLLNLGNYPGLIAGDGTVIGELYSFNSHTMHEVLVSLDKIENHLPNGRGMYQRIIAKVNSTETNEDCFAWTYLFQNQKLYKKSLQIASGDFKKKDAGAGELSENHLRDLQEQENFLLKAHKEVGHVE